MTIPNIIARIEQANLANQSGQADKAGELYLLAARELYELARRSPPDAARLRSEKAKELADLGRSLLKGDTSGQASTAGFATPVAKLTFDDIAGSSRIKEELRRKLIYPLQSGGLAKKYGVKAGSGVLLYGPPGTGKTLLMRALAGELACPFYAVKSDDILGRYVGESEKRLAELFETARQHPRALIFLDEIDGLCPDRNATSDPLFNRLVGLMLQNLDGLSGQQGQLIVVGATNRPWLVDPTLLRQNRLDSLIEVPLPEKEDREAIFRFHTRAIHLDHAVDASRWAEKTKGFSAADLENLVVKAGQYAYFEALSNGVEDPIGNTHLEAALADPALPSVSAEQLVVFERFREGRAK